MHDFLSSGMRNIFSSSGDRFTYGGPRRAGGNIMVLAEVYEALS